MPCYHPLPAWKSKRVSLRTGRRLITFRMQDGHSDMPVSVPCGRCIGCMEGKASEWALRCEHEAKLWDDNFFLTLTYDDASLPPGGTLVLADLQNFWKRARLEWPGLRYFACGEYGEQMERPHYHALVFNWRPSDLEVVPRLDRRVIFRSALLNSVWGLGRTQVDSFSAASAAYVTNYVRKSVPSGSGGSGVSSSTVNYQGRLPPFQVMSRRPGIGSGFVKRFLSDIYPDGFVSRRGGSVRKAPRFYDSVCEATDARMFRAVKRKRAEAAAADVNGSGSRLITREAVSLGRINFFDSIKGRPFEKGLK